MHQVLSIGAWADYSCASRPFVMFSLGPLVVGFVTLLGYIRLGPSGIRYLWLAPVIFGVLFGTVFALSKTITNAYLEGDTIVLNGCFAGRQYQDTSQISQVRTSIRLVGKHQEPFLDIYWPKQTFELSVPIDSNENIALLRKIAPEQVNAYLLKANQP